MSRTHQNLKILGTAGYWVPRKFQKLGTAGYRVPRKFQKLGTDGYKPEKKFWVPMGTGYQQEKIFDRWLLRTSQKIFLGTDGYWVPAKFSTMPTPAIDSQFKAISVKLSEKVTFLF